MSTTESVVIGDRGRLVVPLELRQRQGWKQGEPLLAIELDGGVLLAMPELVKKIVRKQLAGDSLVEELLAERRAEAVRDQ